MKTNSKTLSKKPENKKLGLMSCIVVVVGACIGAGIFFKNASILQNTWHSLVLTIVCWLIAGLGVLCMGLALTEVVSGCKGESNLGIGYWVKTFNNRFLYKACKNFLVFVYTPIILVALAYYFVQALFSAINPLINWSPEWWQCMIVAFVILAWFFFTSGISVKLFNVQSWIIMCFKFIPLLFAIVIGYVIIASKGNLPDGTVVIPSNNTHHELMAPLLTDYSPVLGIVASIPAIFFAFNGFQYPASMTSSMKNPKQLPISMLIGIIIVIVVYILISVSLVLGSNGGVDGLKGWLDEKVGNWCYPIIYILVGVGILSVINGTVVTGINNYEEFIKNKEIACSNHFSKISQRCHNKPMGGTLYCFTMTVIFFIVCTIIGLFYLPISQPSGASFDGKSLGIFNFVDIVSSWDALFIYVFIGIAFIGCLINRKTNKVHVTKSKIFVPMAIISLSLIGISILYIVIQIFADFGIVTNYLIEGKSYDYLDIDSSSGSLWRIVNNPSEIKEHWTDMLISKGMAILMFFLYVGVMFIPAWISEKKLKHHINHR